MLLPEIAFNFINNKQTKTTQQEFLSCVVLIKKERVCFFFCAVDSPNSDGVFIGAVFGGGSL